MSGLGTGAKRRRIVHRVGVGINNRIRSELQQKRNEQLAHAKKIRKQPPLVGDGKGLTMQQLRKVGMNHNLANRVQLNLRKSELEKKVAHQKERMGIPQSSGHDTVKKLKADARALNQKSLIKGGITRLPRSRLEQEIQQKQAVTHQSKYTGHGLSRSAIKAWKENDSEQVFNVPPKKSVEQNETPGHYNRIQKYLSKLGKDLDKKYQKGHAREYRDMAREMDLTWEEIKAMIDDDFELYKNGTKELTRFESRKNPPLTKAGKPIAKGTVTEPRETGVIEKAPSDTVSFTAEPEKKTYGKVSTLNEYYLNNVVQKDQPDYLKARLAGRYAEHEKDLRTAVDDPVLKEKYTEREIETAMVKLLAFGYWGVQLSPNDIHKKLRKDLGER